MSITLKTYPEYRDSRLPWLDQIPKHWEERRLKFLFNEIDDRSATGQETLLSMRQQRGLVPHNEVSDKEIKSGELVGYKRTHVNDVVMNRMRASSGLFARTPMYGLVSPDYAVFRRRSEINVEYYVHLFKSPLVQAEFRAESKGLGTGSAGFLRLYSDRFGAISVPLPSLQEQDRIATFIQTVDELIARLILTKQQLIELLNEQKQAIIQRAVTCGLDPDAPMKPTGLEWLPEVPEHWEVRRLKRVVANINDQTATRDDDEIYVALEHIESWTGKITLPDEIPEFDSQVKRFQPGDILFGKLRPYLAKVARPQRRGVGVGELLVLRLREDSIMLEYLEQRLRSRQVIDLINSSTFGAKMPRADWTFIGNVEIAFPPSHTEQQAILDHIASETTAIDTAIQRAQREIDLIREYRTRLISDIVTGKLDVRGLDLPEPDVNGENAGISPDRLESIVSEDSANTEEVTSAKL